MDRRLAANRGRRARRQSQANPTIHPTEHPGTPILEPGRFLCARRVAARTDSLPGTALPFAGSRLDAEAARIRPVDSAAGLGGGIFLLGLVRRSLRHW